jgi:hypothetical protein
MAIAEVEGGSRSSRVGGARRVSEWALVDRVMAVRAVVGRCMAIGEHGGRGSRTRPVRVEEPVLVPMSDAQRSSAVSAFTEILAAWWVKQQIADDQPGTTGG